MPVTWESAPSRSWPRFAPSNNQATAPGPYRAPFPSHFPQRVDQVAQHYKDPIYENVEVGESFGPRVLHLDEFFLKTYAYATDDYSAIEIVDGTLRAKGLVPGAAIASELMLVFLLTYDPDGVVGLHQKEVVEHFKPVPVGSTITITGRYVAKYMKRGKGYVTLEAEGHDEAGDLVVRQYSTEIMRMPEGIEVGTGAGEPERRISPRLLSDERVQRIVAGTPVGTALTPLVKHVHQAQMSVFSGAEIHKQGIHTVRTIARGAGLKDCLAQGMMESCWASQYLTEGSATPSSPMAATRLPI